VQNAPNYFSYPVGTPDGSLGPRSRGAISQFQATMGFGASGYLNEFEHDILVQYWYCAQAGGGLTVQKAATDPRGTRAISFDDRDEKLGIMPQAGQMASVPATPQVPQAAAPRSDLVLCGLI
jgi:peptidoglycan hydrolase-like protein with peptidoglycan-binding domain